jgi:hypothetical protein
LLLLKPPAIEEIPLGIFVGTGGLDASPTAILLLALAAPVFADSMIFLKKPLFLGFGGAMSPPRMLESAVDPCHPACD